MNTRSSRTRQLVIVKKENCNGYPLTAIAAFYNEDHPVPSLGAFIKRLEAGEVLEKYGVKIRLCPRGRQHGRQIVLIPGMSQKGMA